MRRAECRPRVQRFKRQDTTAESIYLFNVSQQSNLNIVYIRNAHGSESWQRRVITLLEMSLNGIPMLRHLASLGGIT